MPPGIAPRRGPGHLLEEVDRLAGWRGSWRQRCHSGTCEDRWRQTTWYGTSGRVVPTIVNAFKTTIPDGIIYHYDAITPDRFPARFNMELFDRLQKVVAPQVFAIPAVYDGRKNAFTMKPLPLGPTDSATFNITLERTGPAISDRPPKVYPIKLTKVAMINTEVLNRFIQAKQSADNDVLTAITALNIVIRMDPNMQYPFNVRQKAIGGGLELWRGYFQSVRPSQGSMYINLDIATGVMYKPGPLLELCMEHLGVRNGNPNSLSPNARPPLPDRERIRLQRFISGMRITTGYTGSTKTFVIKRVTTEGASGIVFPLRDGGSISFPNVICVEVGNAGAKIPLELCTVPPGQIMRKQIPADKTNDMLEFSKLHPKERLTSIHTGQNVLQYGQSEYIRQFGMNVEQTPITVNARVLPPPVLRYGPTSKEPTIKPANGSWNIHPQSVWAIVIYESPNRFNQQVAQEMARVSSMAQRVSHLMKAGKACIDAKKGPPNLLVVILPEGGNQIYTAVKHFGDVTKGIQTQCLKSQKCSAPRCNIGRMSCSSADVMHPAPGAEGRPSFASLVSSVDNTTAKYISQSSVQVGREEIIADLEQMVTDALEKWVGYGSAVEKGRPPLSHGVSEGRFAHVLGQGLRCNEMRPKITLIIVGKRHHIRMFPQNDRDGDRSGNCQAGTTIDAGLGHPTEFDYYQLTHGGLLGTSRPAHYSDSGFSADTMQNLSFALCHVYARATRSVSIPAPVYYADIVCARAKNHYAPDSNFDLSDTATVASSHADSQLEAFRAGYKPLNAAMANSMYFMAKGYQ
ncbi:argonaute-like protein [Pholiota molesta]|nr:argonaute-like protein [Pholiota molesta]